jgi:predicted NUDIX family phosphoesterase
LSTQKSLLVYLEEILKVSPRPLSAKELLEALEMRNQSPRSKDPKKVIHARLSKEISENKEKSTFMRTAPGEFTLREFKRFIEYVPAPKEKQYSPEYEAQVLVIPKKEIDKIGYFHGLRTDRSFFLPRLLSLNTGTIRFKWKKRNEAENNYYYKQLVVYVIVKCGDDVIRYSRGKQTSLRDNMGIYTIGIGGHVELRDQDIFTQRADKFAYACLQGVKREVWEETGINLDSNMKGLRAIGLLNDDSVKQGLQHIALVLLLELSHPEVYKTEKSIIKPQFVSIKQLADDFKFYEYWSQLCIQAMWGANLKIECQIVKKQNFELRNRSEIILIVGYVGSGKSIACELLEKKFGYVNIRCSKIMVQIIGCGSFDKIGRAALQNAGYKFIHNDDGHNKLAQGIIRFIQENPGRRYVLDGLRYPETYTALTEKLNIPITIIYIDTLIENLWKRHNDSVYIKTIFEDYLNIIYHPVERDIQRFRPIADIVVHNNGSLKLFIESLQDYFRNELR